VQKPEIKTGDDMYLMTPFKRVELMGRILEKIRALQTDDSSV